MREAIHVARGETDLYLLPRMANRHGLVAGATGTGKTVTLQRLAEGFSRLGVPVFLADVKGDLSGLSRPGTATPSVRQRISQLGLNDFRFAACPVVLWDVFGEQGHPVRATISEMGPLLLARLLKLNDVQTGVLHLTFKVADDHGLLLLDLKDLRAMLQYVAENARQLSPQYGHISAASIGAIQRGLLALEQQGGDKFFAEPALDLSDFLRLSPHGEGCVNILAADRLLQAPTLYATFLLYLLSELFELLPEVGDLDKPKLVFFFDEAHTLFNGAPRSLLDKIEQVVRLIRSKGVGIYFVTQSPLDIPETILGQLGNRIQHALRAFTPRDQKAVRAAAETFRPNPKLKTAEAITELGVGEALVSLLDERGTPMPVERAWILPPSGQLGPITPEQRHELIVKSPLFGHYEPSFDRESAYEILCRRAEEQLATKEAEQPRESAAKRPSGRSKASATDKVAEAFATSAARTAASSLTRELVRGLLGSFFGGRKKR
ncbi:MAG: DUF853 domain-containing protein [Gemmataceae bacterium]|nr:DUF853 domain-containing protein [Gemmataceae bacterium]MDW8263734.1 DUF853 family protein [Gemmataceae bacterium]